MKTKTARSWLRPALGAGLPLVLIGLFYLLRGNRALMDLWVFHVMEPVEQMLSGLWALQPLSTLELVIGLVAVFHVIWIVFAVGKGIRERSVSGVLRRMLVLVCLWMWIWALTCWMWNAAYGASTFSERSGLYNGPQTVEDLKKVTEYFAQQAARLSTQVERDENLHFAESTKTCIQRGSEIYSRLEEEFPCLEGPARRVKPLIFSRLQSRLGFTGMYLPFTGEANVNVDAPLCLLPSTIGHEMAHQRMVASETEATFVGIAACIRCDDPLFQYSGYLMGLIHLCNALYSVDAQAWKDISAATFTKELATDWNDNNAYWDSMESSVEEAATKAYDSFLKGNEQELGMRSYGACVNMLISYTVDTLLPIGADQ